MLPIRMTTQMLLRSRKYPGCREFSFWQRLSRADGRFIAVDIRARDRDFGATLRLRRNSTDIATFAQVFLCAQYRSQDLARHRHIAAYYESCANPLILDLGANIGLSALYFAKNWPKATIVGVEPDERNYELFRRNVSARNNIVAIHGAVASKRGRARIVNPGVPEWGYRTEIADANSGGLAAMPVTDLLERHRACEPFICKIDIEGAEHELFSCNTEWVARFPILIIELHDWMLPCSGNSANFLRVIAGMDRDFVLHGENIFSMSHEMAIPQRDGARHAVADVEIGDLARQARG
jgi:FkbM family methyltransferase